MKKYILIIILISILFDISISQIPTNSIIANDYIVNRTNNKLRKNLMIPDIPGYFTLKGDFHVHTIFSDGEVDPGFRVAEAWGEGLDIIAITDHVNIKKYNYVTVDDLNISYNSAKNIADELNIILIPGAEITHSVPEIGHYNALFLQDVNKLKIEDPKLQIKEAIKQDAFIIWNHPGSSWINPIDTTQIWSFQKYLFNNEMIHGIEVFNTDEWFPIALDWCIDSNLTIFANTDIHRPINYEYDLSAFDSHRAFTLVFSKSRDINGVKEALFDQMTVGYFGNTLVGKKDLISQLIKASVKVKKSHRQESKNNKTIYYAEIVNSSDMTFVLQKTDKWKNNNRYDLLTLRPRTTAIINYSSDIENLEYIINNCFVENREHPKIIFTIEH